MAIIEKTKKILGWLRKGRLFEDVEFLRNEIRCLDADVLEISKILGLGRCIKCGLLTASKQKFSDSFDSEGLADGYYEEYCHPECYDLKHLI